MLQPRPRTRTTISQPRARGRYGNGGPAARGTSRTSASLRSASGVSFSNGSGPLLLVRECVQRFELLLANIACWPVEDDATQPECNHSWEKTQSEGHGVQACDQSVPIVAGYRGQPRHYRLSASGIHG